MNSFYIKAQQYINGLREALQQMVPDKLAMHMPLEVHFNRCLLWLQLYHRLKCEN